MTSPRTPRPKTPLPWSFDWNILSAVLGKDGVNVASTYDKTGTDAEYLCHAANAYPALVEALQQALRWDHDCHWMKTVGKVCERCGDDGETGNDVVPGQAEAAIDLLTSLSESPSPEERK